MVLHGSAYQTSDLDICYSRSAQNLDRIVAALSPFEPRLRVAEAPEGLDFPFDAHILKNGLNFTLQTGVGNLDLLGQIDGVGGFDQVERIVKFRGGEVARWVRVKPPSEVTSNRAHAVALIRAALP